jgi:endonuclease III
MTRGRGSPSPAGEARGPGPPPMPLPEIVEALRKHYGPPTDPMPADPWGQILWENVAYLADDSARAEAFEQLKETVGVSPAAILKAPRALLLAIGKHGILPEASVEKLRQCATIVTEEYGGDPSGLAALPAPDFRQAVRKFPGIGAPGADRLLLFARKGPVVALDSNGLRALVRLGYGRGDPSYAKTYASVQRDLEGAPHEFDLLIEAFRMLRQHGRALCRRSKPVCNLCPLQAQCPLGLNSKAGQKPARRPGARAKAPASRKMRR